MAKYKYDTIKEATINFKDPVISNERVTLIGHSFSLHNAGDSTADLGGRWTIAPKSTFQIAAPQDDMVFVLKILVSFSGGSTNRLEIAEVQLKGCDYSNYAKQ